MCKIIEQIFQKRGNPNAHSKMKRSSTSVSHWRNTHENWTDVSPHLNWLKSVWPLQSSWGAGGRGTGGAVLEGGIRMDTLDTDCLRVVSRRAAPHGTWWSLSFANVCTHAWERVQEYYSSTVHTTPSACPRKNGHIACAVLRTPCAVHRYHSPAEEQITATGNKSDQSRVQKQIINTVPSSNHFGSQGSGAGLGRTVHGDTGELLG